MCFSHEDSMILVSTIVLLAKHGKERYACQWVKFGPVPEPIRRVW